MNTIYRAAALLAVFAAVAPAFAQQGQNQAQWKGQRMTPEQREQRMAERFRKADTNHDGKLSLEEAKAGMPMVARNFDQIDTGRTGSVTLEQVGAFAKAHMGQHPLANGGNGG